MAKATKGVVLHQILAVVQDAKGRAKKLLEEAVVTFSKRGDHFKAHVSTLKSNEEGVADRVTSQTALVSTVYGKLDYLLTGAWAKMLDITATRDRTNQAACADVLLPGNTRLLAVPATTLLQLESDLATLRKVCEFAPTLEPAVDWQDDPDAGPHIRKNANATETIAKSDMKAHFSRILAPATDRHAAQVEVWTELKILGTSIHETWSGKLSSADKSKLLNRIDEILDAVRFARQEANCAPVIPIQIGDTIAKAILDSIK